MALFEEGTLDIQGVRFMTLRKCLEGELTKTGSNNRRAYVMAMLYNEIPVYNILHKEYYFASDISAMYGTKNLWFGLLHNVIR
jgi:hypothetical protein